MPSHTRLPEQTLQAFKPGRRKRAIVPALLVAASLTAQALAASVATAAPTTPRYALTVLPTLGAAFDSSAAAGINDKGWIAGDANVPGSTGVANATTHATLWRHGVITDLGTLGGPNSAIGFVTRPNNTGLITGNAQINTVDPFGEGWALNFGCDAVGTPCAGSQYEVRGFAWRNGVIRALPTLGGNNAFAFGGANDRGEIVGTAENAVHDPTCLPPQVFDEKAVIWGPSYGQIRALPLYPGDTIGASTAINDLGQVVGGSGSCGPPAFSSITHALLWQGGSPINLGSLGGVENIIPTAINNRGQVVGWSDLAGDTTTHAFLWQNGVMSDLGTLPGDVSSFASGINDSGQAVGQSCDQNGNCRAFLWQDGTMTDLNAATDVTTTGGTFELVGANGINARGEIVGSGIDQNGQERGFAAVPCNGPSANDAGCSAGATAALAAKRLRSVRTRDGRHLPWRLPALRPLGKLSMPMP